MNRLRTMWAAVIVLTLIGSVAVGQQQPQQASQPTARKGEMPMMQGADAQEGMSAQASSKMEYMADAMANMARTCDMMMTREMAMFPAKMIAAGVLGTVAAAALILLVVLEVQWIRLVGLRIRQAKSELR